MLYGTTETGGAYGKGAVFSYKPTATTPSLEGSYSTADFVLQPDGHGGTDIDYASAVIASGPARDDAARHDEHFANAGVDEVPPWQAFRPEYFSPLTILCDLMHCGGM